MPARLLPSVSLWERTARWPGLGFRPRSPRPVGETPTLPHPAPVSIGMRSTRAAMLQYSSLMLSAWNTPTILTLILVGTKMSVVTTTVSPGPSFDSSATCSDMLASTVMPSPESMRFTLGGRPFEKDRVPFEVCQGVKESVPDRWQRLCIADWPEGAFLPSRQSKTCL